MLSLNVLFIRDVAPDQSTGRSEQELVKQHWSDRTPGGEENWLGVQF